MVQRGEGLVVGGDVGLQWVVRVGGHRVVGRLEQGIGGKRVEGRGAIFVASGLKSSTLVYCLRFKERRCYRDECKRKETS